MAKIHFEGPRDSVFVAPSIDVPEVKNFIKKERN